MLLYRSQFVQAWRQENDRTLAVLSLSLSLFMLNVDLLFYLLDLPIQIFLRQSVAFRQGKGSLSIADNGLFYCGLSVEVDESIKVLNLPEHFLVFLTE